MPRSSWPLQPLRGATRVPRVMEGTGAAIPRALEARSEELGLAGIAISEDSAGRAGLKELGSRSAKRALLAPSRSSPRRLGRGSCGTWRGRASEWLAPIAEAGRRPSPGWSERRMGSGASLEMKGTVTTYGSRVRSISSSTRGRPRRSSWWCGSVGDEGLSLAVSGVRPDSLERPEVSTSHGLSGLFASRHASALVGGGARRPGCGGLDEATALLCAEMEGGMRKVLETAVDYAAERSVLPADRLVPSDQTQMRRSADRLRGRGLHRTARSSPMTRRPRGGVLLGREGPSVPRTSGGGGERADQGGVGYAWEYDAHLYFRRALASKALLGDASSTGIGWRGRRPARIGRA